MHIGHEDVVFMQDGAPSHRCKFTAQDHAAKGIRVLDWPGNSPDLHPIEYIWHHIKHCIRDKYGVVTDRDHMVEFRTSEWELLEQEEIDNSILRNIKHMEWLLQIKGGNFYHG